VTRNRSNEDRIRDQLHRVGLKATCARRALLELLDTARNPISFGELQGALVGVGMHRVSLHRNLEALTRAGIVRRVVEGDLVWRYELNAGRSGRAVVSCSCCGASKKLPRGVVSVSAVEGWLPADSAEHNDIAVLVTTRCKHCRR
jgi:Fe2+ or Zn2+ uptake regulation protein